METMRRMYIALLIFFLLESGFGQSSTNSLNSQTASSEWKGFINWPESPQDENEMNEVNSIEVSTTKAKKRKVNEKGQNILNQIGENNI